MKRLTITSDQRYKYNGKELDRMHGLDWYDYGTRMQDPALGKFFMINPGGKNIWDFLIGTIHSISENLSIGTMKGQVQ